MSAVLFYRVCFYSPCYETPKNAIKKNEQNNRGRKKQKNGGKKTPFFVMSPRWIFPKNVFYHVFELPLLRNSQKRDKTNRAKQLREKKTKKRRGKNLHFFVMSPDGFFEKLF
jgi:hypothetical protein